jgi:hypothetical protein
MNLWDSICETVTDADNYLFGYGNSLTSLGDGAIGGAVRGVKDCIVENPGKTLLVVGVTVATGGLALAAAPTIAAAAGGSGLLGAASTGTAISTLSGAALSSASLASIGGGALAVGGGGMAAGATTIATAGAVTGGLASGAAVTMVD